MTKRQISFRLDRNKVDALDRIARSVSSSRNHLLASAVENYLDLHRWQVEQIQEGLREADASKLIDHAVVVRRLRAKIAKRQSQKLGADRKRI